MARKGRKNFNKRKLTNHVSTSDRAAKAEKAKYERCRRRRLNIVKKLDEFHKLFDAEIYFLARSNSDRRQVHWYCSEDGWTPSPEGLVSG